MTTLNVTTEPETNLVVSLAEAKEHLRIVPDNTVDDAYITALIEVAVTYLEIYMRRPLMPQSWTWGLSNFPIYKFYFPLTGVTGVTEVSYYDESNEKQVVSPDLYILNLLANPQEMMFINTPTDISLTALAPIRIVFNCGYATKEDIPKAIKQAILVMVAYYYRNRLPANDNVKLDTAEALVYPYRLLEFV